MGGSGKDRRSSYVGRRQAANFAPAIVFAATINRPLNWLVTINYSHTACPDNAVSAAFERLRDNHYTRWLRYKGVRSGGRSRGPATYVWVAESVRGHTHIHWMVHVPRVLLREFKMKVPEWVMTVSGSDDLRPGAIHFEPVERAAGLGKYLMKGIDPRVAKLHRIVHEPQGIVVGKRCGVSTCLGKAARDRYKSDFGEVAA